MQSSKATQRSYLDAYEVSPFFAKPIAFKSPSVARKKFERPLSFNPTFSPSQKGFQNKKGLVEDIYSQAIHCISHIEDPLWKHVCCEVNRMMGPASVLKIWNSRLGTFSPQHNAIDVHCQAEESSQFIQQYSFIILGILHPYFPSIKNLNIKFNKHTDFISITLHPINIRTEC